MDGRIRLLLHNCRHENSPESLQEPYENLKRESSQNLKANVGTDLFVLCAEFACQHKKFEIAEDCIKMYFKHFPPENQYLCRAYMCQARIFAPTSTKNPEQIDKAVVYLLKAINFAKQNSRYHFLVYNASVLYWQFCRLFLKPNYKQFLAKTLHQVVKALDEIDDKDYEWRAQLMIALIECHIDAGKKDDASEIASSAAQFTRNNVPNLYKNVLELQIQHRLTEYGKLSKETKSSPDLHLFFKIHRLKMQLAADEKNDVGVELAKFYKQLTGQSDNDISGTSTELSEKSSPNVATRASTPVAMETNDRVSLILELAKMSMSCGACRLTADCLDYIERNSKEQSVNLTVEFLRCELMVKSLGEKQENYSQSIVQIRLQAIEKLEQYLMTALRFGDPRIIQVGCTTIWNLCLPLFQFNLRHHVRKPLTLLADAMDSIDSPNSALRCQIHTELAKCEESEEQLEQAMLHLRKALSFDDDGLYTERLETLLTRLRLRATLYATPERPEDIAAMIIEQACTSSDSGTSKMKRASLVKAGNVLAPDAFLMVLESENENKDVGTKASSLLSKLAARVEHFETAVGKASGHLKRLGAENEQERLRIWADLTKTARKQQLWDVARVAARFCLLYDDGRWSVKRESGQTGEDEGGYVEEERGNEGRSSSGSAKKGEGQTMRFSCIAEEVKCNLEKDFLRILAEVHFINAEALIQLLKCQGVKLCDGPTFPVSEDVSSQELATEDSPQWIIYCDWLRSLSRAAISEFQRASDIGCELQENWLVCNSAVYLLNYTTHLVAQRRHRELVPIMTPVLKNMRNIGHVGEGSLLCQVCNILATGLMRPWYPKSASKTSIAPSSAVKKAEGKKDKSTAKGLLKTTTSGFDPDAVTELKQALEYLDYALQVTNGSETRNLVAISVRHSLIKTWVHCKQLLSQQIPKNSYAYDSEDTNSQGPMCRCLCALEMLSVNLYGLHDFSPTPTLQEVVRMVGNCIWSDDVVALEVWSRLAVLAFNADNHSLVMECGKKALTFDDENKYKKKDYGKNKSRAEHIEKSRRQLLYYSCAVLGQSLVRVMKRNSEMRRDALGYFVKACRFGELVKSYDFVASAARHYWNTARPLVNEPLERQLLKEQLGTLLNCLASVSDKNLGKDDEDEDEQEGEKKPGSSVKEKSKKLKKEKKNVQEKKKNADERKSLKTAKSRDERDTVVPIVIETPVANAYEEDLKMRAAMYGVLFQAFADQGEWEQGLKAMDDAVRNMPRTCHRLLIFKHRVITKAKLGRDVQFDMGKFKNESELVISSMWHHVALNSSDLREQFKAYQNAIEVLKDAKSDWQKVDILLELGEWLFVNEFPLQDAVDQFMAAIDTLVSRSDTTNNRDNQSQRLSSAESTSSNIAQLHRISDVKTLEYLTRIHVMLAQLVGMKSSDFINYCLFAVACVQRIWKVSLDTSEVSREGVRIGAETPVKKAVKNKEQKEGKSEKSIGKSCFPSTLQNWATFEIPDKFVECFKNDKCGKVISKTSFVRPTISVHYLNILVHNLCCYGYHHLCLPIASLLRCLAKHVMENEVLLRFLHWKTMEICQDLHLVEAVVLHERVAKSFENHKEDVAKSREEIEVLKEKQRQVEKVEETFKHSEMRKDEKKVGNMIKNNNWMTTRREVSRIERREIWLQQAAIFIDQGYYQAARELLNEANISAVAFNDHKTCAEVLYHLALLAYRESKWQQSISLLKKLQNFKVDQEFWLKTILLMVDSLCGIKDRHDPAGTRVDIRAKKEAIKILKQSLSAFKLLSQDSPNKACKTEYITAKLQAKLGSVTAKDISYDENSGGGTLFLLEACEHLRTGEILLISCGLKRESIDLKCERAAILRRLAAESRTKADKRNLLLEALTTMRSAVQISDALSTEVECGCTFEELCSVSLPVERTSVQTKLYFGELAVEIMNEHNKDERARRNREARKKSIEQLIDAFVQDEPVLTEQEKQWSSVTKTIVDETLVHVNAAFSRSASIPYLKAKCYLLLGKCLRSLASYLDPVDDPQWKIDQIVTAQREQVTSYPTSVDQDDDRTDPDEELEQSLEDSKTPSKRAKLAELLKVEHKNCQQTLTQTVECLTQCVQLALKHGYNEIISECSYLLMDIVGKHDMSTSSSYLALYQSCSMARTLRLLVERCQTDSSISRFAALMKQRDILAAKLFHQQTISLQLASNIQSLAEFEAWRRLSISKNHMEIVKELSSPSTLYLVLQHSKDRSYLYASTLDKSRSGISSAKPGKQVSSNSVSNPKAMVCRSKVNPDELDALGKNLEEFRMGQARELVRQNYLRRNVEETKNVFSAFDNETLDKEDVLHNDLTVKENEDSLQKQYLSLIGEMESYLSPVLEQLKPALNEKVLSETVVILADDYLLRLPLESLSLFRNAQCLARDFSLQMHHHRLHSPEVSGSSESGNEAKKTAGSKKKAGQSSATGKSQDKKGEKKVSKEQGIPKEGIPVDITGLRYIIDPYNECSKFEDDSPEKVFTDTVVKYKQLSSKWSGVIGTHRVASVGEWQKLMKESSIFLFYGTQKCLNYVPPSLLVSSTLQDCSIMIILDHVVTNESFLRQSKVDASKTRSEVTFEFPFESAAVLSLTGVNCILSNQWNCKLRENKEKLIEIFQATLEGSKTIGNALRTFVKAKPETEQPGESAAVVRKPSTIQSNYTVADSTVLYGIPYFVLNPLKA